MAFVNLKNLFWCRVKCSVMKYIFIFTALTGSQGILCTASRGNTD